MRDCDQCHKVAETRLIQWKGPRRYMGQIHVCRDCYREDQELRDVDLFPWELLPLTEGAK